MAPSTHFDAFAFCRRNIAARRGQAVSVVALLFLGVFATIAVGLNRIPSDVRGTGGFGYFTRTALPVAQAPDGAVPLRVREGSAADCFNLNNVTAPAVWGVDPAALDNATFSFATTNAQWVWLDGRRNGVPDATPTIADASVIQWILKKKVGDTIEITGDDGAIHRLIFVAALDPSVFQGAVVISDANFRRIFPDRAGYQIFLSHEPLDLKRYGAFGETTRVRLARFTGLQNSYLLVFFQLSLLGLVLGLGGALLSFLRTFEERRGETLTLVALGFSGRLVERLYRRETLVLVLAGVVPGALAGFAVVLAVRGFSFGLLGQFALTVGFLLALVYAGACWIAHRGAGA